MGYTGLRDTQGTQVYVRYTLYLSCYSRSRNLQIYFEVTKSIEKFKPDKIYHTY